MGHGHSPYPQGTRSECVANKYNTINSTTEKLYRVPQEHPGRVSDPDTRGCFPLGLANKRK